jgi:hypothetical protein
VDVHQPARGIERLLLIAAAYESGSGPGRVETPFIPQKLQRMGVVHVRRDRLSIFCGIESGVNPGASSGHAERLERSHGARNVTRSSNPDCREEQFDTDDVHHAREVVGEHVQRHFGRDIGQPLHQKVRRTHPHLQRGERVLDGFAAHTHGLRVLIEPRLRGFDDCSCSQRLTRRSLAVVLSLS